MESTSTKVDVIKPVFLKAGIPLAIAAAGFIFARITRGKGSNLNTSSAENQINDRNEGCLHDLESHDSSSLSCLEADHSSTEASQHNSQREPQYQHMYELDEEILVLRSLVKDLHLRELQLEVQYLHYRDIKDQELMLMELEKMLFLEITKVELMDREISSVEKERQWCQNMVIEYQKILARFRTSRSRNRMLQRRVKKLLRKTKEQRQFIREQCMQIEAQEAENSRTHEELVGKAEIIRKLEDEIQEQKTALWQLQVEKNDLSNQIELANKLDSSKIDLEKMNKEDNCSQVVSQLEKLENERAVEIKELIYLRWSNACLRHELLRKNQEEQEMKQRKNQVELGFGEIADFGSDDELSHATLENGDSCLNFPTMGHARAHSKRKKFIKKFKRWVERSEKAKQELSQKEKHEAKHSRRQSVPYGADEAHTHARNSYSSA